MAVAGGIDIDSAESKKVDIRGGQILLSSKDNIYEAIYLKSNIGTSETIKIENIWKYFVYVNTLLKK